ncbi:hypothetical protein D3C72_1939600 [compost metagenome]
MREEAHLGIAKVGDRVQRNIRHGLAERGVEHQQVLQRPARQAQLRGAGVGAAQCSAAAGQADVQAAVALGQRARRGMAQAHAHAEILEKVAGAVLLHCLPLFAHRDDLPGIYVRT